MTEALVACVQMHADRSCADNIEAAARLVARAAGRGAQIISLPERWNGTGSDAAMVAGAESLDGESAQAMAEIAGWPVGLTICYDLRFPEQYRELAIAGAEAFVVPAGFTMATGRDHWEVLLRARAIENAAYVIAANQHGFWDGSARFARSMIIDPWGVVLANAGDGEGICVAAIDRARVAEVRRQIPVLTARRPEAYRL